MSNAIRLRFHYCFGNIYHNLNNNTSLFLRILSIFFVQLKLQLKIKTIYFCLNNQQTLRFGGAQLPFEIYY
ncbi:unnamed protein product (macronuclear) [Paramecium tetraurelia]|uniref:Uncharacterized protein n=1 Tax=Paramecium tetraurelia TaxID=5888 RepID=A0CA28_PARTE|nr:uncharacterized protein GSPATT00036424001 [Paramecium tetraurelia]CAK67645.1 unnamed protein product [Paramecium tetraurelia]|eukprot:XP_001435042.1 hypothetical protein (macronuclear) [Paramecium tetraurelia strain d4-2]